MSRKQDSYDNSNIQDDKQQDDKQQPSDDDMKTSIQYGQGIRLLNQDLWETIISFIISANNNIPRIKGIIEKICKTYGEKIAELYPSSAIFMIFSSCKILIFLPSVFMISSAVKAESVRMALLVVILQRFARSSRLNRMSRVFPSFSNP